MSNTKMPVATLTYSGFQPDFKSFSQSITFTVPGAVIQLAPQAGRLGPRLSAVIHFREKRNNPKTWH